MSINILSKDLSNGNIRIRITRDGDKMSSYQIDKEGNWSSMYYYDYGVNLQGPPYNDIKDLIASEIINRYQTVDKLRSEINILEKLQQRIKDSG